MLAEISGKWAMVNEKGSIMNLETKVTVSAQWWIS